MLELLDEIREGFANLDRNRRARLEACEAWIYREQHGYGVEIPLPVEEQFVARFAGVELSADVQNIDGRSVPVLALKCSREDLRTQFALICAEFVDPGEGGLRRERIQQDPRAWWDCWRQLLGNIVGESRPYAVLAELLTLEHLAGADRKSDWTWAGPDHGSHDLVSDGGDYEVKSTIARYRSSIEVAGEYQLQSRERPLSLVFWRFEPGATGEESIDRVVRRLGELPAIEIEDVEGKLARLGLGLGEDGRTRRYAVLEALVYPVDEKFPRVTPESFKNDCMPPGINSFSYEVELSGLGGTPFPWRRGAL